MLVKPRRNKPRTHRSGGRRGDVTDRSLLDLQNSRGAKSRNYMRKPSKVQCNRSRGLESGCGKTLCTPTRGYMGHIDTGVPVHDPNKR